MKLGRKIRNTTVRYTHIFNSMMIKKLNDTYKWINIIKIYNDERHPENMYREK